MGKYNKQLGEVNKNIVELVLSRSQRIISRGLVVGDPQHTYDCCSMGLVALSLLLLLVALLIKLDSSGPMFFRQERMSKGLRPFRIDKFPTMIDEAARRGTLR